jgi:hypothetical protein
MTFVIAVRGLLISMSLLTTAACDGTIQPVVDSSRCDAPDYQAALVGSIDEVQIWAGNQAGLAPEPLLISVDQEKIATIAEFFLDRSDHWYIAAGETYDPASRRRGSEFTLRFKDVSGPTLGGAMFIWRLRAAGLKLCARSRRLIGLD